MSVHIEGMGIIGSILAHRLEAEGIAFTWNDARSEVNAWSACTGAVYPSGHAEEMADLGLWQTWHREQEGASEVSEVASYWFTTKHPPHGGKYKIMAEHGELRLAELVSLHIDAQRLVTSARARFAAAEQETRPPGSQLVIAHGFTSLLKDYVWGWSVAVKLRLPSRLHVMGLRPAMYFRTGRALLGYAYPMGKSEWWYAGSLLLPQATPKRRSDDDVRSLFERWTERMARFTAGGEVVEHGPMLQGWRPRPSDESAPAVKRREDALIVRPRWHDGVRRAPSITGEVVRLLA